MEANPLTTAAILDGLGTRVIPQIVLTYTRVSSTMDVAREFLQKTEADDRSALILADEQTAGRGRMNRRWITPPGSALLFSLALHPRWLAPTHASALIWMASVAVCEGIAASTGLQPRLKWPNDVLLAAPDSPDLAQLLQSGSGEQHTSAPARWHKVAGILLETNSTEHSIERAIIGCGLNISANPPSDAILRYPATNVSAVLGRPVERLPVLRALLKRLDYWYMHLEQGEFERLFAAWRALLVTLGQTVQIETSEGILTGRAEDVEPSGALQVRDATGQIHVVSSGDVNV